MKREEVRLLVAAGGLLLLGVIVFFGRVSIAQFFGTEIFFGMPATQRAVWQVRLVGGVGAILAGIGVVMVVGVLWGNPPGDKGDKS